MNFYICCRDDCNSQWSFSLWFLWIMMWQPGILEIAGFRGQEGWSSFQVPIYNPLRHSFFWNKTKRKSNSLLGNDSASFQGGTTLLPRHPQWLVKEGITLMTPAGHQTAGEGRSLLIKCWPAKTMSTGVQQFQSWEAGVEFLGFLGLGGFRTCWRVIGRTWGEKKVPAKLLRDTW